MKKNKDPKSISKIFVFVAILVASYFTGTSRTWAAPTNHTIVGKIVEVVPSKKEIYVLSDGTKYEYYFNALTKVLKKEDEHSFSDLKEGQQVRVVANKIGQRLDPVSVSILE